MCLRNKPLPLHKIWVIFAVHHELESIMTENSQFTYNAREQKSVGATANDS